MPTNSDPVLAELDADIARLLEEVTRLREMRSWWKSRRAKAAGQADNRDSEKGPSIRDWVLRVLSGGVHLNGADVARSALELGWTTPSKHPAIIVRNTLRGMEEKSQVNRDEEGKYFLPRHLSSVREKGAAGA